MNDIQLIEASLGEGSALVNSVMASVLNGGFNSVEQVVTAQQSLAQVKNMAQENYVYAMDMLQSVNQVVAAFGDSNQLVPNIIQACNNLKSNADLAYVMLATEYGIDILGDGGNSVQASDYGSNDIYANDSSGDYLGYNTDYDNSNFASDDFQGYNNILANDGGDMGNNTGISFNFFGSK